MRSGLLAAFVLFSCSPMTMPKPAPTIEPLPAFELTDVNPASSTNGQVVGPLALRGKVTGWYFTHSN
ncbi:MAG: hypothetical protein GQE15_35855 [Archangiaceae bacterium]|nr:hypothetical protein [Archangiaceae bacterium]